jgi:hypothetical protein
VAAIDGKNVIITDGTTKTKASFQTLPLVLSFRAKLLEVRAGQERNRKLCGRCYRRTAVLPMDTDIANAHIVLIYSIIVLVILNKTLLT